MCKIGSFVKKALKDDLGRGDLYSRVGVNSNTKIKAIVISKQKSNSVLSGVKYAKKIAKQNKVKVAFCKQDGDKIKNKEVIAKLEGKSSKILKIERVFLNLLQHSSAIATKTNTLLKELKKANTNTILLDTRKTTPHLRIFEKYSTLNGGAINHRMGLDDCLMLKDTHLKHILQNESLSSFIAKARAKIPWSSKIEIECPNVEFAKEAIQSGCDIIMCDNMDARDSKKVVDFRDANAKYSHILIEASGNITKSNIKEYARVSKVDAISSGSIIHQAKWIDLSMRVVG